MTSLLHSAQFAEEEGEKVDLEKEKAMLGWTVVLAVVLSIGLFFVLFVVKNKFERNLAILLNNLSSDKTLIDKLEKEIIFSAALFNLRQTEETLKKIVNN
jgi:hypothetical protein